MWGHAAGAGGDVLTVVIHAQHEAIELPSQLLHHIHHCLCDCRIAFSSGLWIAGTDDDGVDNDQAERQPESGDQRGFGLTGHRHQLL